jgi:formylglycine-generating enzyme required for sulfatase activity
MAPHGLLEFEPPPWTLECRGGKLVLPEEDDLLATGRFGRFRLESLQGRGPRAAVYRARDDELRGECALKVFRPDAVAPHGGQAEELMARARIAAAIEDEHVVRLLEAGWEADRFFLASEHVEGETLGKLVTGSGPLGWRQAASLMAGAARGIQAGHALGLVHGSVKPTNVMVVGGSFARVADFASPPCAAPAFLAPELRAGVHPSPQSDLYALGSVFERAVRSDSAEEGGERLLAILRKCTAGSPEDRYPGCGAVAEELGRLLREVRQHRGRRQYAILTLAILVVVAAAIGAALHFRGASARGVSTGEAVSEPPAGELLPQALPLVLARHGDKIVRLKDGAQMVYVPATSFVMGSARGPADERPAHRVTILPFFIDRLEVSVRQYQRFLEVKDLEPPPSWREGEPESPELPAVGMTWYRAQQYCEWVGGRLPTEAEWEVAARGPESQEWPWGNEWVAARCNWRGAEAEVPDLAPVGSFEAGRSPFGVINLVGNAAEWCADWYSPSYYRASPNLDPAGAPEGEFKAVRGGSYASDLPALRPSARGNASPILRSSEIGFRCVVEIGAVRD